ncbi:hypothetical protein H6P81_007973 [Aristolochia fimbriata]|uniref:S-adenosyl-L-methionine-dependent methyltransferase superfamily protein n=1 Tax=Aristolochia fimbriata TaxID=158543 RepID=A0AAV7F2D9_ARIFI|nr:hypothetical protein H6P81_007973 [Aristolochia fimbriata]
MGKHGRKQKHRSRCHFDGGDNESDCLPASAYNGCITSADAEEQEREEEKENEEGNDRYRLVPADAPSKFDLYQKSVQSPKGDISYLMKFFLLYVGGRLPLHLQEDFCGTALLSTEWLRGDPRRTAIGLDMDLEALLWCLDNNINKIGSDSSSRLSLFHGNVLQPDKASLIDYKCQGATNSTNSDSIFEESAVHATALKPNEQFDPQKHIDCKGCTKKIDSLPGRDIVCAFNYSCCCLQSRAELIVYFKHAHSCLSRKGGIFVMDLYGGTSSEAKLRLKRRFSNFTYVWEQEDFDIINRTTRISLHFHVGKREIIPHAFSYNWRLWSLPEIKDCLLEAGFRYVHFWIREMPDTNERGNSEEFNAGRDVKYEELSSFQQRDAWNAYIVAVTS